MMIKCVEFWLLGDVSYILINVTWTLNIFKNYMIIGLDIEITYIIFVILTFIVSCTDGVIIILCIGKKGGRYFFRFEIIFIE